MRSAVLLIGLMLALSSGCANSEKPPPAQSRAGTSAERWTLTLPIQTQAPENTEGEPRTPGEADFGESWYINADRTLWMLNRDRTSGRKLKTAWFRPRGTQLQITGRRLDAPAPPLVVDVPPAASYPRRQFTPSMMTFPTDGIWEILAKAGQSEARFVIRVPSN